MNFAILLPLLLQNMPAIIATGEAAVKWVSSIRTAAMQAQAWTPELEASFVASLDQDAAAPEWQPDLPASGDKGA